MIYNRKVSEIKTIIIIAAWLIGQLFKCVQQHVRWETV